MPAWRTAMSSSRLGEDEISETIDVNLRGLILVTKHFMPIIPKKGGVIINISSGAGKRGYPGLAVYCTTKSAVLGFTETLAKEAKSIKIIAVCPGGVDTEMYMSMSSRHPSLKPEHIAAKILDIVNHASSHRSGSSIEVYSVTDTLEHLRLKHFDEFKAKR